MGTTPLTRPDTGRGPLIGAVALVLGVLAALVAFAPAATADEHDQPPPPAECVEADAATFSHTFGGQAGTASITVDGDLPLCEETSAVLVSYEAQGPGWSTSRPQHLFDADARTFTESATFSVEVPQCYAQTDLIWGTSADILDPITDDSVANGETYSNRGILIAHWNGGSRPCEPDTWMLRPQKHWHFDELGDARPPEGSVDVVVTVHGEGGGETVFTFDTTGALISEPSAVEIPNGAEFSISERNLAVPGWSCEEGHPEVEVQTSSFAITAEQAETVPVHNTCTPDPELPPPPPPTVARAEATVDAACEPLALDVELTSTGGSSWFEVEVDGELAVERAALEGTESLEIPLEDDATVDVVITGNGSVVLEESVDFVECVEVGGETQEPPAPPVPAQPDEPEPAAAGAQEERAARTLPRTGATPGVLVMVALAVAAVGTGLVVWGRQAAMVPVRSGR